MEGLGVGGAVFFLKTPKGTAQKEVTQVFYNSVGEAIYIEPGTARWNELMGRFKLSEYFVSPELWDAAQSIEELRKQLFKGKKKIKIVLRRDVEGYGDVIMMTVIPRAFKEAFGNDVFISVYTTKDLAPLLEENPDIDEIKFGVQAFEEEKCDLRLNANNVEFKAEAVKEEIEQKFRRNRANLYLQQLGLWLIDRTPVYVVSEKERKWAKKLLEGFKRPIIAVQAEASVKAKTYPYMDDVMKRLVKKGYSVVHLDERKEKGDFLCTLREMGALINESDVVVSADSLALHIAGALKKKGVAVFGYTEGEILCQDYEKIFPIQAVCPYKKLPCWWTIDCLVGGSTREKEVSGYAHCLKEGLSAKEVAEIVELRVRKSPKVFLAMLTFNLLGMTRKAIASIKSFHDYELFVVDNESEDGTQAWLEEVGIPYVSKRTSVAEAQNIAMRKFMEGDGEYFIFLNNDIVLRADYINELIAAQKRTKAYGVVGSLLDGVPPWAVDDVKVVDKSDKECVEIPAGSYSATLLTRECIEKVGYFDEQYMPRYIEDNDYTLRIRLAGKKFFITSHAKFFHALGAVVHTLPEEMKRHQERWDKNICKFVTKWGIHPHEAQDLSKLGLEWFTEIHGRTLLSGIEEKIKGGKKVQILVKRNMGGYGDIIFTTILAKRLKEKFGNKAMIGYCVPQKFLSVLEKNPNIDFLQRSEYQYGCFDFVIDLTDLEYRVELKEIEKYGEIVTPRTKIYLDVLGMDEPMTEARLHPDYFVGEDEIVWANKYWGEGKPRIGVIIKGSNLLKVWPKMGELASQLREDGKVLNLDEAGLSFRQVGALVATADVIVSPDTGVSNLAATLDIPVVTIFGNRNGRIFQKMYKTMFPVQGRCPHLKSDYCDFKTPCFGDAPHRAKENINIPDCLKSLTVAEVYSKVTRLLETIHK